MKSWFLLLLLLPIISVAQSPAKQNQAAFYIEKYGRLDQQRADVQRAQAIFDKMVAVADKKLNRWPQLIVIKSPNNHAPLALALADGSIILSQQALKQVFTGNNPELGDAQLAFIIGHELAHLAHGDFWHYNAFNKINGFTTIETQINQQLSQAKEMAADERGFIYAAMAGFTVNRLLENQANKGDFFHKWQQQLPQTPRNNHSHPTAKKRTTALIKRLKELQQQLQFYYFGVRLSLFGRCDDAIYFYQAFQQHFPARELLNNLGYCYLQEARKTLGQSADTYWLPLVLDHNSQLAPLAVSPLRNSSPSPTTQRLLRKATEFLQTAIKADPYYVAARINLAVTAFYADEIYLARAEIEKARKLKPDDIEIQALRALILYKEGLETDTWPTAIRLLQQLAKKHHNGLVNYNLARLLDQRGRAGANTQWQQLAKNVQQYPLAIQQQICAKTNCDLTNNHHPKASKHWQTPFKLGRYIKRDANSLSVLETWKKQTFDWQAEVYGAIYQKNDKAYVALALAGYSEMLVFERDLLSDKQLQNYCDTTLQSGKLATTTYQHCPSHWIAIKQQNHLEIWLIK